MACVPTVMVDHRAAVARGCGFRDVRRFRLVFRRMVGVSPAHFRAGIERTLTETL